MIPKVQLTSKGAALLAKVPAGEAVPVTRWQIGTGALASGESLDRTALVMPYEYITVSEIMEQGNRATVLGQFTNVGRSEFDWEELGLFADDPDEGEILLREYKGLRVPSAALRMDEEGSLQLFCRLGAYVYSKPVDLVYRGDGFCLVRSAQGAADERILRQGDLVISTARALTDGMIFPDN